MLEPAHTVIRVCGGIAETARLAERSENRVRRWTYPRERGGTDGMIPTECQQALLTNARREGIPLEPGHFFRRDDLSPAARLAG